jgi:hypothetical protein
MNQLFATLFALFTGDFQLLAQKLQTLTEQTTLGFSRLKARISSALAESKAYTDTKSNQAQANAQGYADTQVNTAIGTEVTNRNAAIATAKGEAASYTDGIVSNEAATRNTAVANAIQTAAQTTNAAIATEITDRNAAVAMAKGQSYAYTDSKIQVVNIEIAQLKAAGAVPVAYPVQVGATSTVETILAAGLGLLNRTVEASRAYLVSFTGDVEGEQTITFGGQSYTVSAGEMFSVQTDANGVISNATYFNNPFMEKAVQTDAALEAVRVGVETVHNTMVIGNNEINVKLDGLIAMVASLA